MLFLQPAAHVAAMGVDLDRLRHTARFGVVNLASLPRKLRATGAVVNCIDTSATARRVLELAAGHGVPRIYLFDGIYDVANAYYNPAHRGLGQMDPLLYTHVACVDRWSHRAFAALGAHTHAWLPPHAEPDDGPDPAHGAEAAFLVATARSPAFDAGERGRLRKLLALTIAALDRLGAEYRFRTGDTDLLTSLGVPARRNDARDSFARCIRRYKCLITTPSTVATTAMLTGKPTAILDYRDGPLTQQAGWRIHRSTDIDATLASMLEPSPERMTFQAREVAHLTGRTPVEDFILRAATGPPPGQPPADPPAKGRRISIEYPLRWIYVNWLKPFRKRF